VRALADGYTMVILFRYRNSAEELLKLYQGLPAGRRKWFMMWWLSIGDGFIGKAELPVALEALGEAVADVKKVEGDNLKVSLDIEFAREMMKVALAADRPAASAEIGKILKTEVANASLRANMVFECMSAKADAVDIVTWYFTNYAATAFEVKTCADFLRANLPEQAATQRIDTKAASLEEAAKALR
jgi:hypothetical protein